MFNVLLMYGSMDKRLICESVNYKWINLKKLKNRQIIVYGYIQKRILRSLNNINNILDI